MADETEKMIVVYNDTCPICSREVEAYRRASRKAGLPLGFEGLSDTDPERFGLTRDQAARRFHVVKDGTLYDGMDAFALVWDALPKTRWLARLVRLPGIRGLTRLLYDRLAAPALYALHTRRERRRT